VGGDAQGYEFGNEPGRTATTLDDAGDHRRMNAQLIGQVFFLDSVKSKPGVELGLTGGQE
jgi:hypothetical protein